MLLPKIQKEMLQLTKSTKTTKSLLYHLTNLPKLLGYQMLIVGNPRMHPPLPGHLGHLTSEDGEVEYTRLDMFAPPSGQGVSEESEESPQPKKKRSKRKA